MPQERYRTATWKGKTVYKCTACAFDAFTEAEVNAHWDARHATRYRARAAEGGLVDQHERPIAVVEEVPPEHEPKTGTEEEPPDVADPKRGVL